MYLLSKFKKIKTVVFDMDGVLTDGNLFVNDASHWIRNMNVRDGYALQLAIKSGYEVLIISGSDAPPVTERLGLLGVQHVFMNVKEKEKFLVNFSKDIKLELSEMMFMGDDIPDYGCMKLAGLSACPANAASEIKEIADYISPLNGGDGCVRDVLEKLLKLDGKWPLQTTIPST